MTTWPLAPPRCVHLSDVWCLDEITSAPARVELCAVDRGVQTVWTARIGAAMTTRSVTAGI